MLDPLRLPTKKSSTPGCVNPLALHAKGLAAALILENMRFWATSSP